MVTVTDVEPDKLINALSKEFESKAEFKPPVWSIYVKTGRHKERPPEQKNWWFIRLAAILRTISINGPVGVERLRTKYGGREKWGKASKRSVKGSGNIIRKALQQLDKAGLTVQSKTKKGRVLAKKGQSLLDKMASTIIKEKK